MTAIVSPREVVEALDLPGEGWAAYLNPDTAEIVSVSEEELRLVEKDIDPDELPEWQQDHLPKVREAFASSRFLRLPDRFEIHEWGIMERFAEGGKSNDNVRSSLMRFTAPGRCVCSGHRSGASG